MLENVSAVSCIRYYARFTLIECGRTIAAGISNLYEKMGATRCSLSKMCFCFRRCRHRDALSEAQKKGDSSGDCLAFMWNCYWLSVHADNRWHAHDSIAIERHKTDPHIFNSRNYRHSHRDVVTVLIQLRHPISMRTSARKAIPRL